MSRLEDYESELNDLERQIELTEKLLEQIYQFRIDGTWTPTHSLESIYPARMEFIKELNNVLFYFHKNRKRLQLNIQQQKGTS